MSAKVVVTGVILVFLISVVAFMIEFFIPLSAGAEFKFECRAAMIRMELSGGLKDEVKVTLTEELTRRQFTSITVSGPGIVPLGSEMTLLVEADYSYSGITSLFSRSSKIQHMKFEKTAISRMVTE